MACERREGSQFWRSLRDFKHEIRTGIALSIGDEAGAMFWLDRWFDGRPFRENFLTPFVICVDLLLLETDVTRAEWVIQFKRVSTRVRLWHGRRYRIAFRAH
jgi:hypothetical protein